MLTGLLVFAMVVLRGFPETASARWLDRTLGSTIAAIRRIERKHLIFVILMTGILLAGTELLAMAGPLDIGLVIVWDISAYIDVVLTTVVVATATRSALGWRAMVARFTPRRSPRARRRLTRKSPSPVNDDDSRRVAFAA